MKKLIITVSALALLPATANAQLLGGGLGGSIGGSIGNTAGSVTGSGTTTVTRGATRIGTRSTTDTQVKAPEVAQAELPEVPSNVDAAGSAMGQLTNDNAALSTMGEASVSGTQAMANSMTEVAGAANGGLAVVEVTGMATGGTSAIATPQVAVPSPGAVAIAAPSVAVPSLPITRVNVVSVPVPIANVSARRSAFVSAGVAPISHTHVTNYVDTQYRTIERDLAGTGASVQRRGNQIVIDMPSDVTFAFDKSDIRPRFYGVLNALSGTLSQYPATFVDIIGHTDAKGNDEYNLALSERRANSVASYLAARSTSRARLYTEGRGEFEPVDTNATVEGRAANRRVEIILTPYAE